MHATMPRTARLDTPGLLHHIMIRGIERRRIFNDDKDRENIIERLSILRHRGRCYLTALSGLFRLFFRFSAQVSE